MLFSTIYRRPMSKNGRCGQKFDMLSTWLRNKQGKLDMHAGSGTLVARTLLLVNLQPQPPRERERGGWPSRSQVHEAVCLDLAISSFARVWQYKKHAKSVPSVLKMMILNR
jgi:hypothetical protein